MDQEFNTSLLQKQDLVMISITSWKRLFDIRSRWLAAFPSVLIMYEPAIGSSLNEVE